jgi:hypothetical protein
MAAQLWPALKGPSPQRVNRSNYLVLGTSWPLSVFIPNLISHLDALSMASWISKTQWPQLLRLKERNTKNQEALRAIRGCFLMYLSSAVGFILWLQRTTKSINQEVNHPIGGTNFT